MRPGRLRKRWLERAGRSGGDDPSRLAGDFLVMGSFSIGRSDASRRVVLP